MKKIIPVVCLLVSSGLFAATPSTDDVKVIKKEPIVSTETKTITHPNGVIDQITTKTTKYDDNNIARSVNIKSTYKAPEPTEGEKQIQKMYKELEKERKNILLSIRENRIKLQKELNKDKPSEREINKIIDNTSKLEAKLIKEKIKFHLETRKLVEKERNNKIK